MIEYEISVAGPEGQSRQVHVIYASAPRIAIDRVLQRQRIGPLPIGHIYHLDMVVLAKRHVQRGYRIEWTGERWRRLTDHGKWFDKGYLADLYITEHTFNSRRYLWMDPNGFKDLGIHSTDKPGTIPWQRAGEDAGSEEDRV